MVRPFVMICQEEKQEDLARDALEFASKKMKPEPDSAMEEAFEKLGGKTEREPTGTSRKGRREL